jgi:hypothetical protein
MQRSTLIKTEAALGENHQSTLICVHRLALSLLRQGRPLEAEPLFRRALAGYSEVLGERNPETQLTARNLCFALNHLGRRKEVKAIEAKHSV